MSHLPERENLHVEERKVTKYLLNLEHEIGGPKAVFFLKRGFTPEHWEVLAQAIREHGATRQVTEEEETPRGRKYEVQCQLVSPDGKNPCILSVWIKEGTKPLRLVTAHPNS